MLMFRLLQALSKALTEDELIYLKAQFNLLEPDVEGRISLHNFKMVITHPSLFVFCFNVDGLKSCHIMCYCYMQILCLGNLNFAGTSAKLNGRHERIKGS